MTHVVVLAGGTGGAKMTHGFQLVLPPGELTVVANVADDTELWGLAVSPDLDSIMYTLGGLLDTERGWGLRDETWNALGMLERYGEPTWFRIGDRDLATHLHRTRLLRQEGLSLTDAAAQMATALGISSHLLPVTDGRLRTRVETDDGVLDFQEYFVGRRQEPPVRGLLIDGIDAAKPTSAVLAALAAADLIVLAPSNPLVSIGPILAVPGLREALAQADAPRLAVSPIIGGRALKGPADRMLTDLGHEQSAVGVARLYAGVVDQFVLDTVDAGLADEIQALGMVATVLPTVMSSDHERGELARRLLEASGIEARRILQA